MPVRVCRRGSFATPAREPGARLCSQSWRRSHQRSTAQNKAEKRGRKTHKWAVISPTRFLQLLRASPRGTVEGSSACLQRERSVKTLHKRSRDESNDNPTLQQARGSGVFQMRPAARKGLNANEAAGISANGVAKRGRKRTKRSVSAWTLGGGANQREADHPLAALREGPVLRRDN